MWVGMTSGSGNSKRGAAGRGQGTLGQLVKAESFIQLALALPIACVLGWFLGSLLDKHFGTHWIGIVGILLGAVGGFIRIFTLASSYMKQDN